MKSETQERMSIPFLEEAIKIRDNLLRDSQREIRVLRQQMQQIAPRAMAYDIVEKIMMFVPPPGQPNIFGPDILYRIDDLLNPVEASTGVEAE